MLKILLSPAKSIDTNAQCLNDPTIPQFETQAEQLVLKFRFPKIIYSLMFVALI